MGKKIFIPEKMPWKTVQTVTAVDLFKIQNVNLVQNVGALGSLKRNQNRIRIFPPETNKKAGLMALLYREKPSSVNLLKKAGNLLNIKTERFQLKRR